MDLSILQRSFAVTESPGLDTLDPRMGEISDRVQGGDFVGAAEQVLGLLDEGICDMRLIGYAAFGAFVYGGVAALLPAIEGLTHILEDCWEAFGPVSQREKGCQSSLTWFAKQTMKRLQREEGVQGGTWAGWIASVTPDDVETTVRRLGRLQGAVDERLGGGAAPVLDGLSKLRSWLDQFKNAVPYPEEEPEEPEVPEVREEAAASDMQPAPAAASAPPPGWGVPTSWTPPAPLLAAQGSPHLALLLRKLEAFSQLVEREEFARALIVADDVNETLERFDPTLYFPSFFKVFARMQALHASQLIEFAEYRETPEWRALQTLYRIDVDEFVNLQSQRNDPE